MKLFHQFRQLIPLSTWTQIISSGILHNFDFYFDNWMELALPARIKFGGCLLNLPAPGSDWQLSCPLSREVSIKLHRVEKLNYAHSSTWQTISVQIWSTTNSSRDTDLGRESLKCVRIPFNWNYSCAFFWLLYLRRKFRFNGIKNVFSVWFLFWSSIILSNVDEQSSVIKWTHCHLG